MNNSSERSAHITLLNIQDCLGVDGRRHSCVPWDTTTLCGCAIQTKKQIYVSGMYDCYKCDAKLDELSEKEDAELRGGQNVR